MRGVEDIRADIDRCDEKLLSAFLERVELVKEIARAKVEAGLQSFDSDRERVILQRALLRGPHAQTLMTQILTLCRSEMCDEREKKELPHD